MFLEFKKPKLLSKDVLLTKEIKNIICISIRCYNTNVLSLFRGDTVIHKALFFDNRYLDIIFFLSSLDNVYSKWTTRRLCMLVYALLHRIDLECANRREPNFQIIGSMWMMFVEKIWNDKSVQFANFFKLPILIIKLD